METKNLLKISFWLAVGLLIIACGGGESPENGGASTPSSEITNPPLTAGFLPTLGFTLLDNSAAERSLQRRPRGGNGSQSSSAKTVIERWDYRLNRVIEETDALLSRLNAQEVDETGSFTGKGKDGLISGTISELSNDATYHYEALICYDNTSFLTVKWSEDERQVETVRDFSAMPSHRDGSVKNMLSKIIYSEESDAINVEMVAHGTPWHAPDELTDEDQMTHYIYGQKASDGTTAFKSVQDWYATVPTTFIADGYLTGKIEADETGEYVAFLSFKEECASTSFDENSVTGDSWCLGKAIGADSNYTAEELSTAWSNLQEIGIASQSALEVVTLETNLSCP